MGALTREENTVKIVAEVISMAANTARLRLMLFTAPATASTTAVHAAMSAAALVTTGITNPDVPRVLSITGGGSGHVATGNVVIKGTDIRDASITDTIALNSNTTVNGVKAFKTVTSIDLTGVSTIDANDTVAVGTSALLGLDRMMPANLVIQTTVNGTIDTAATVAFSATAISQNTVSPATAPNASRNFYVLFATNEAYPNS